MIRKTVENNFADGKAYVELACLSTDSKPTGGMITGSLALEVDTGDVYAYDETSTGTWNKIASLGGDGSAQVSSPALNLTSLSPSVVGTEGEDA